MRPNEVPPKWLIAYWIAWVVILLSFQGWVVVTAPQSASLIAADRAASVDRGQPWWTERSAGFYGGVLGGVGGLIGGVVGILGGVVGTLASLGRSRELALHLMHLIIAGCAFLAIAGLIAGAGGLAALAQRQPFWVYYPLLLAGGILVLSPGGLVPAMYWFKRLLIARYEEHELRKMQSMDI